MLLSQCHWRKTPSLSWVLTALLVFSQVARVSSVLTSLPEGEQRCKGTGLDYSRLQTVSTENAAGIHAQSSSDDGTTSSFVVNQAFPVRLATAGVNGEASSCVVQRLRINEAINGIPIYGSDSVVTLDECYGEELAADAATSDIKAHVEDVGFKGLTVREVTGKSFSSVQVKRGYTPRFTKESTVHYLSKEFQVDEDSGNIEPPKLYIYVTELEDYLVYFSDLLVETDDGETNVIRVIVHSYDLTILSICLLSSSKTVSERRLLRQDQRELQSELCSTCATRETLILSSTKTTQEIRSLYLDNTGKNAMVTEATVQSDGSTVNVPGSVPSVFYTGTFHCFSTTFNCALVELPTTCGDALSDVHYISVVTLQHLQSALNVMGGLAASSSSPQSVRSRVHYGSNYCNAFYRSNEITFGDCDCIRWTPLTTVDIIAHELAHGVTRYSSGLIYDAQSGGLNEGYSDIYGTVIEYHVNDSLDTPDFLIGEQLQGSRGVLRHMENPPDDGRSIGSVCDYRSFLDVHHSSGVPNKAYVKSVRECEAHSCSTSESECAILLGNLFMYTNIYRLSSSSTYLDAATQTCSAVGEFFTNTSPTTSCTTTDVLSFIVAGWMSVSVDIDSSTCAATNNCPGQTPAPTPAPATDPQLGCQSATSVSIPSTLTGDTSTATTYSSRSCGSARNHNSPGVWYSVFGTGDSVMASLCNTPSGDTQLSVWTGSCSNLQCVVGNDDFCSVRSQVTFPTTSGQTYYIYVYGYLGATFSYSLDITTLASPTPAPTPAGPTPAPTPNEVLDPSVGCSSATALSLPSTTEASTLGAPRYSGVFCGGASSTTSSALWYSVAGTGGEITASTCNFASYDTQISVWTGDCGSLTCVGGNDDTCSLKSQVTFSTISGQTYYIKVYGYAGGTGNFELTLASVTPAPTPVSPAPTPALDIKSLEMGCLIATSVSVGSSSLGTTVGAQMYASQRCDTAYPQNVPGDWFSVAGTGGSLTASVCTDTFYDSMISVWSGDCASLVCVGGNDDGCGSLQSTVIFDSTVGTTYSIFVHGYAGDTGSYNLQVTATTAAPTPFPTPVPTPYPTPGGSRSTWVFGTDSSNDGLYIIDSDTGALVSYIGDLTGYTTPVTMASRSGELYIYNNSPSPGLLKVDPVTAAVTQISSGGFNYAGSIAFRNGVLYAHFQTSSSLYSLNVNTGVETVICSGILSGQFSGMDTNPITGLLHLTKLELSTAPTMYTIDPSTCTLVLVGQLSVSLGSLDSIVWNPNTNKFLGVDGVLNNLFDLDVDGTVTNVRAASSSVYTPQGMAMYTDVFPSTQTLFPTQAPIDRTCSGIVEAVGRFFRFFGG
ncbi:Neutral protease [Seminavis robusta]|uniref:Neutral protease n=1 Tax=Seminavis robusta TaxID=568900 RepID=A0A9N8DNJ3_9STRA|nr:Neutral protease [Seminavis robusta]|eukprot:Sro260_g101660.1 Neutral protease (1336) ;mRNA; r:70648-76097